MAIKLLSVDQMKEFIDLKNRFLSFNGPITFISWSYDDNELYLSYQSDGEPFLITIPLEDVKIILQMDPSIKAFNDFTIRDVDNITYETYDDYFDTCPDALFIDFIAYGRTLHKLNINQLNKAA